MEFRVEISTALNFDLFPDNPYGMKFQVINRPELGGLSLLDRIRSEFGCHLLPENIYIEAPKRLNADLYLSEKEARESGHFGQNNLVKVVVPEKFFGPELHRVKKVVPENERRYAVVLDQEKVIEAWKEAGFPLKWGIQEDATE